MSEHDIRELVAKLDQLERDTLPQQHSTGFRLGVSYIADGMREHLSNLLFESFLPEQSRTIERLTPKPA